MVKWILKFVVKNLKESRDHIAAKNMQDKEKVYEYGKLQRSKAKEHGELGAYRDYTHMLPVELMLKKDKEKLLEEYKENRNFKYIKLHIERVTKGA